MAKDDLKILRALYLKALYDVPEKDLAAMLSVGQASISRWWTAALKSGRIRTRTRHTFVEAGLSADCLRQVRQVEPWMDRLSRLRDVVADNGVTVRSLRVFRSAEKPGSRSPVRDRLERFSRQAVGELVETIGRSTLCAVASGFSVWKAVEALAAAHGGSERSTSKGTSGTVRFVPVWPEDPSDPSPRISSSALSERLDEIFNARSSAGRNPDTSHPPPSLNGVPPFTPHYFSTRRFRQFLEEDFPGYRAVFGARGDSPDARPLIDRVDMLLTSIGARDRAFGRFHQLLIKHARVSAEELSNIVAGDVGGVLIPSPDCTTAQRRRVRRINSIWNGLQPEHLEQIAIRSHGAEPPATPGVVIFSIDSPGGGRAHALAAAIRAGLVNELIIDEDLANGLERELLGK